MRTASSFIALASAYWVQAGRSGCPLTCSRMQLGSPAPDPDAVGPGCSPEIAPPAIALSLKAPQEAPLGILNLML